MDDITLVVLVVSLCVASLFVGFLLVDSLPGSRSMTATERLALEHPSWSPREIQLVSQQMIVIGMTTEMVVESWGRPGDITRSASALGTTQIWTYYTTDTGLAVLSLLNTLVGGRYSPVPESISYILYFQNGTLTSWTEF